MSQQIRKLLEVKNTTGLSGSSIYRMASAGTFPKPIKIGVRSSGWVGSEVDQWLDDRIATSRNEETQP